MATAKLEKLASIDAQLRLFAPRNVSDDDELVECDALLLDRSLDILQSLHGEDISEMDGKVSQLEHVFIRGSRVRFMIIPDMLKNAPMFKRLEARIKGKSMGLGVGRGRAVAMRAKVGCCTTSEEVKLDRHQESRGLCSLGHNVII